MLTIFSLVLETISHEIQKSLTRRGRKGYPPHCTIKKGPAGTVQEYCFIQGIAEAKAYFEEKQANGIQDCKQFKESDFNSNTTSVMYIESQGRLGNQLLGYSMLIQLRYTYI